MDCMVKYVQEMVPSPVKGQVGNILAYNIIEEEKYKNDDQGPDKITS